MKSTDLEFFNKMETIADELFKPKPAIIIWYRQLKRSLYNLWYYLPVIWKDRDWDQLYIYDLLATKLEKVLKYRKTDPSYMPSVGDDKVNRKLLECAILARRLSGKFEFAQLQNDKLNKMYEDLMGLDCSDYLATSNSRYLKTLLKVKKLEQLIEEYHRERLFHLLSKHISKFWD